MKEPEKSEADAPTPKHEESPSNKPRTATYVNLARLCHDAFVDRRKSEWRVYFGFWIAIGLIAYVLQKRPRVLFTHCCQPWLLWIGTVGLFFYYSAKVLNGHTQDKNFKHRYMALATGATCPPDKKWSDHWSWMPPIVAFNALVVGLFFLLAWSVSEEASPPKTNKTQQDQSSPAPASSEPKIPTPDPTGQPK